MRYETTPANFSDSIPTLVQWSKTVLDRSAPIQHRVEVIWAPNLYSNYTLQTSSYRLRLDKGHPYYSLLERDLSEMCESGAVLFLETEFEPKLAVTLIALDEERCVWDELGTSGFKLHSVQKRKTESTPKTRKQRSVE